MKLLRKICLFVFVLASIATISSCKKKCEGGSGGGLTFILHPQHHNRPIPNIAGHVDTVRVKYNSLDAPSSLADYDAHFEGDTGTSFVRVSGLKCGDYYFFVTGVDTGWDASHNTHVKGALPYSTNQTSGTIDLNVAVGE